VNKIKVWLCCCILATTVCSADEAQISAHSQAERQLKSLLADFTSFSAGFTQTVTDALGEELQRAEGKLFLQRPNLLHWQSLPPNELTLIADGETVWYTDPFAEQVIAMEQEQAAANHPIMLLADITAAQWADYLVSSGADHQFTLVAQSPQTDVIEMYVSFKDEQLSEIRILDRMEQVNRLQFDAPVSNVQLSPDLFVFSLPEGFDLDDQRDTDTQ
jgi:outer membrane lipoprotein carrier protein